MSNDNKKNKEEKKDLVDVNSKSLEKSNGESNEVKTNIPPPIVKSSEPSKMKAVQLAKSLGLNENYIFVIKRKHSPNEEKTKAEWLKIFIEEYNFDIKIK